MCRATRVRSRCSTSSGSSRARHFEQLRSAAHKGLKGLKIAPFYGCQILRPSKLLGFDDPDKPESLERIIQACGGVPIDYPAKIKCCGFPIIQAREDTALGELIQPIEQAKEAGADAIVTPCPLCHLSLDAWQSKLKKQTGKDFQMPILHLSQLIGVAAGLTDSELKFKRHVVSVQPVDRQAEGLVPFPTQHVSGTTGHVPALTPAATLTAMSAATDASVHPGRHRCFRTRLVSETGHGLAADRPTRRALRLGLSDALVDRRAGRGRGALQCSSTRGSRPGGCGRACSRCRIDGLPAALDGLRVAHLSDFHLGAPLSRGRLATRQAVAWVAGRKPDLVCVTGDLVSHPRGEPELRRLLAALGKPYVVLGNHDIAITRDPFSRAAELEDLREAVLLRDEAVVVEHRGARVQITASIPGAIATAPRIRRGGGSGCRSPDPSLPLPRYRPQAAGQVCST